jgi:sugar O-acyltransferase (sialic acid O-acetyltransferase NeuD family)
MKKLVIFGAKGFAELAHYYFSHDSGYSVVAFAVDAPYLRETTYCGLPTVTFEEAVNQFPPEKHEMFVAIGIHKVNRSRAAKAAEVQAKGYRLASFVSSRADVAADLVVRPNTMIMERAGIQPFVTIGQDTIIWSSTRIGFHTHIGDHCWIVGPLVGESATIGDYSFLGLNSTVAPFVQVGVSNIIGAGALILNDTKDFAVYRGQASTPARAPSSRLWNT